MTVRKHFTMQMCLNKRTLNHTIINNLNNICKNENHWSLLITRYSLLGIQTPRLGHDFY